eukprot:TRINITY_DN34830_c0_g1_i1.p1 TRINITY_DN34830_c0_g1~~TRINITY_DN34830_c0_g1_i1.p1  ORF type:complete len:241 (+),score=35.45 TRINITY_DN34830_c0_g1_i1:383-1105(+)
MDMSIGKREGTYGRIAPLFDLFSKHIDVGAGVIDADYRGPVWVILFNHTDESFEVKAGDRIAQLILLKIAMPDVLEVDDLDLTIRDADDFNSTSSNLSFLPCTMKMALEGETQTNTEPSMRIQKTHNNIVYKDLLQPRSLLRVKKLSENAVLPSRATHLSAGYDLSSASVVTVPARGKALIPTDLGIGIPERTYARIAPRSGLAWKHSIDVGAGVINADYRGPVRVILLNHSDKAFEVNR